MIALPEEVEGELMNGMGKSKKEPNGATSNESMLSKRLLSECCLLYTSDAADEL